MLNNHNRNVTYNCIIHILKIYINSTKMVILIFFFWKIMILLVFLYKHFIKTKLHSKIKAIFYFC